MDVIGFREFSTPRRSDGGCDWMCLVAAPCARCDWKWRMAEGGLSRGAVGGGPSAAGRRRRATANLGLQQIWLWSYLTVFACVFNYSFN
jgi:hypothetical protein